MHTELCSSPSTITSRIVDAKLLECLLTPNLSVHSLFLSSCYCRRPSIISLIRCGQRCWLQRSHILTKCYEPECRQVFRLDDVSLVGSSCSEAKCGRNNVDDDTRRGRARSLQRSLHGEHQTAAVGHRHLPHLREREALHSRFMISDTGLFCLSPSLAHSHCIHLELASCTVELTSHFDRDLENLFDCEGTTRRIRL